MKRILRSLALFFAAVLLAAACRDAGEAERMAEALRQAEQQNAAFVPFTTDSILRPVAYYYDRHGTPNERMKAHYLLASAYRDMGDAPRALDSYQDALDCADTTDTASLRLLSRIYGQMAYIFNTQSLSNEAVRYADRAIDCAMAVRDTSAALSYLSEKSTAYSDLLMPDSVISLGSLRHTLYTQLGEKENAAISQGGAISSLIEQQKLSDAKPLLDEYCRYACNYSVESLRDNKMAYSFYLLGKYYHAAGMPDSAVCCFRKELEYCRRNDHRLAAYKGLYQIYSESGITDSVAKYARLYCTANDSSVQLRYAGTLLRMQSLYNYGRAERIASEKTAEAAGLKTSLLALSAFLLLIAFLAATVLYAVTRKNGKLKERELHYELAIKHLQNAVYQKEQLLLDSEENREKICLKEKEIEALRQTLDAYKDEARSQADNKYIDNPIVYSLYQSISQYKPVFIQVLVDQLPLAVSQCDAPFMEAFAEVSRRPTPNEMVVTLLCRLHFTLADIRILTDLSSQQVTNIRTSALFKLFGKKGGAKTFDRYILARNPHFV